MHATAEAPCLDSHEMQNGAPHAEAAGATVLVVDDSAVDRRLSGSMIQKATGLRAVYAANGREALELIAREAPAVVVTDLQMPEMGGLELVTQVRERFPHVPTVLMTAYGSEEVAMQALRAGAANYVPKKKLATDLVDTIRAVLAVASVLGRRQKLLGCLRSRVSRFELENDPELISSLIQLLQGDLADMEICDETARMRVGVALQECLANALFHGNLEVSSDLRQEDEREFYKEAEARRSREPFRGRRIHVQAKFDREGATFVIRDEGPGFDTSSLDRPIDPEDLMRIGGRGMLLIRTFMDEVSHNAEGNQITLVKHPRRTAAAPRP